MFFLGFDSNVGAVLQGNSNIFVHNNTLDQVYDAAVTNQGSGGPYTQRHIFWRHNRISNSEYCWEVWDHSLANESAMADISFEDNVCHNSVKKNSRRFLAGLHYFLTRRCVSGWWMVAQGAARPIWAAYSHGSDLRIGRDHPRCS